MPTYFRGSNILTPDYWTEGSGGFSGFGQNGNTGENQRVTGTDPWGNSAIVWESRPSGDGNADGGWNSDSVSVDEYSLYRFSVWVKRTSGSASGYSYLGTQSNFGTVRHIDSTYDNGNPYWECQNPSVYTQNQWYLLVGHVFPSNYAGNGIHAPHPDTGRYTTSGRDGGVNFCNISSDLRWTPGTTSTYHRTYHYYCGDSTTRLQWFDPRIDKCDGSEPTIAQLLAGTRKSSLISTSASVEGASLQNQKIVASGGIITTVGDSRIHRFNSSGTLTVTSVNGSSVVDVDYLIVAGGGGGGTNMGGGGGGGGVLNGKMTLVAGQSYTVTVGAGGAGAPAGTTGGHPTVTGSNGSSSSINSLVATGGGWGGVSYNTMGYGIHMGNSGGSGGGSSGYNNDYVAPGYYGSGSGISGQGNRGGYQGNAYYSGGGGGAGAAGTDGNSRPDGGAGRMVTILGRPFYWGGGGGGASYSLDTGGYGGVGGGGGGALGTALGGRNGIAWGSNGGGGACCSWANTPGGNAAVNTGGGGGGGSHYNYTNKGGDGGSGIVIIRYKYR
jgi:hypothetical protein